jgi:Tfp pilus assembly protein PilO
MTKQQAKRLTIISALAAFLVLAWTVYDAKQTQDELDFLRTENERLKIVCEGK